MRPGQRSGGTACTHSQATLPLSPPRYQEVQAAQKALGTAVVEALPKAERVLATVQQVGVAAALHLASPSAPASPVSSVVLGALHWVGIGENVVAGKPVWPWQRQMMWLIFSSIVVD